MLVYSAPIQNEDTLQQRFLYACQTIRNAPGAFERVLKSMVRCVHVRIDSGGVHFTLYLCLYNQQFALFRYVFKFLTP